MQSHPLRRTHFSQYQASWHACFHISWLPTGRKLVLARLQNASKQQGAFSVCLKLQYAKQYLIISRMHLITGEYCRSLHAQPLAACEWINVESQSRGGMWRQPFVNRVALCKYSVYYDSLAKEHAWAEHHTSLQKRGLRTLLNVSVLNHKKVPMSCLKWLDGF